MQVNPLKRKQMKASQNSCPILLKTLGIHSTCHGCSSFRNI